MREWLSHDFIDNCYRLKPFSEKKKQQQQFLIIKKNDFLQKLHRWIWAFCSHIGLCTVHLHFLRGMNLQFSTIALQFLCFTCEFALILVFDSIYRSRIRTRYKTCFIFFFLTKQDILLQTLGIPTKCLKILF